MLTVAEEMDKKQLESDLFGEDPDSILNENQYRAIKCIVDERDDAIERERIGDPMGDLIQANRDQMLKIAEEGLDRIGRALKRGKIEVALKTLDAACSFHPMHGESWRGWPDEQIEHDERCIDHTTCAGMIEARNRVIHDQAKEIAYLRAALLPFAAAAGRPGRLADCMTDQPLPDDAVLGLGVKVSAWKRAAELSGA